MIYIYGAGAITGQTEAGAKSWRFDLQSRLVPGIKVISPLRCEPAINGQYQGEYDDKLFGTAQAIVSKNRMDVRRSDAVLAYMPKEMNDPWPSVGTISEMAWGVEAGKPVILVTDDERLLKRVVVTASVGWVLNSLSDAARLLNGLFADYVNPVELAPAAWPSYPAVPAPVWPGEWKTWQTDHTGPGAPHYTLPPTNIAGITK